MNDVNDLENSGFPPEFRGRLRWEFLADGGVKMTLVDAFTYSGKPVSASGSDLETAGRGLVHIYETLKQEGDLDLGFEA